MGGRETAKGVNELLLCVISLFIFSKMWCFLDLRCKTWGLHSIQVELQFTPTGLHYDLDKLGKDVKRKHTS